MDDPHWLITSTTYGTWLPGNRRGFVGSVRERHQFRTTHNIPGTEFDSDLPRLQAYAKNALKCPPIVLTRGQADALLVQFHETARYRRWGLRAVGIMRTHMHLIVGVPDDPDPEKVLGDFKAYGSRRLNLGWGKPASETWWTENGSTRKLPTDAALMAAVEYVRNQLNPLLIWIAGENPMPAIAPLQRAGGR